jgi:hypothetical protein
MPQVARPIADVANSGWTPTPLYTHLNTPTPNDLDPITSPPLPPGASFTVQLDPLARPITGTHTLTVRFRRTEPAIALVTYILLQGEQSIAARSEVATQEFVSYDLILTEPEIDVITDYADLRLRVVVSGYGSGSGSEVPGSVVGSGSGSGSGLAGSVSGAGSGSPGSKSGSLSGSGSGSPGSKSGSPGSVMGSGSGPGSGSAVGSGSGAASGSGSESGSGSGTDVVGPCCGCDALPRVWTFSVSGFYGGESECSTGRSCADINGSWTLTYVGDCVWNSGDNGACVEGEGTWTLFCDANDWILGTEGVAGAFVNIWKKSRATWNCLGENTLTLVTHEFCSSVPDTITITPG